ncbi:AAA family ATPase [Rhodococcus hoagii]|nr:AAA family ATPase [Prescottella equi]NKW46245.1 AAA family ATPase [Prescottella equi]
MLLDKTIDLHADQLPSDIRQGNPENFRFRIPKLTIGDSEPVELPAPGVTVVVGGNNVGKSTLLRQIYATLQSPTLQNTQQPSVLTEIHGNIWVGSNADLAQWVLTDADIHGAGYQAQVRKSTIVASLGSLRNLAEQPTPSHMAPWFVDHRTALDRHSLCVPTARRSGIEQPPSHPIHVLETSAQLLGELQSVAHDLFGLDLTLDRISGDIGIRVGTPNAAVPLIDQVTDDYVQALAALPYLSEQGDGVQSALGLLLPIVTGTHPVMLIDEPEAFLHPPQARRLGRAIARIAQNRRSQVIVATHDTNFLQGLVEESPDVAILHLARDGNHSEAKLLPSEDVRELWADPVLRYSNALDGLFHAAVIVTENDRDSHFYAAAIDSARKVAADQSPAPNIMFLAAHGKTNIAPLAARLGKLGVRVISTPDLDVLNDKTVLETLVNAHGGDWTTIEPLYDKATAQFRQPTHRPKRETVAASIAAHFASLDPDSQFTNDDARTVKEITKVEGPWSELKRFGTMAFRNDKESAQALLARLDEIGIVTVRVGELENFLTTANAKKGPGWLTTALNAGAHETQVALDHARRLLTASGHQLPPT